MMVIRYGLSTVCCKCDMVCRCGKSAVAVQWKSGTVVVQIVVVWYAGTAEDGELWKSCGTLDVHYLYVEIAVCRWCNIVMIFHLSGVVQWKNSLFEVRYGGGVLDVRFGGSALDSGEAPLRYG